MAEDLQPSAREEQARRLAETLRRQLGATLCGLMQAPDVVELMLNPDGRVWVDRLGQGMSFVCMMAPATAESLIATVASTIRSTVTRENPILECELPLVAPLDGARFEALIPPVVSPGPAFTIRRKASSVFRLEAYERQGIMTTRQRAAIERAVRARQNILVVGGTGMSLFLIYANRKTRRRVRADFVPGSCENSRRQRPGSTPVCGQAFA
jgi:type IV secretion system protein TrbB